MFSTTVYVYVPVVSASVDDSVPTSVPADAVSETSDAEMDISVGDSSLTSVIVMAVSYTHLRAHET